MDLINAADTAALVDLAFRKPARSSSISTWSRHQDPERDARGANGAVLHDDLAFHTQEERNPWWLVDLGDECFVHEVKIVNRRLHPERFLQFQISTSLDGTGWTRRFVKTDNSPVSSDADVPWTHLFAVPFLARYLMISLLGQGMLHLRRVQVLGCLWTSGAQQVKPRSIILPPPTPAPSGLRIGLVGNCQVSALAALFRRSSAVHVTAVADINNHGSDGYEDALFRIHNGIDIDFLVSQPMSDDLADLSSRKLQTLYGAKFITFTNVFFSGLHPDIIYVGSFDARLQSPMGDYHSKIILASYLHDLSEAACFSMFCDNTYERFGYFAAYDESFAELLRRDEPNAVKFGHIVRDMTVSQRTMLSINHPAACTLVALGACIAEHLGVDGTDLTPDGFTNPLNDDCLWPVYDELRAYHQLQWQTPMTFFPKLRHGGRGMGLEAFIAGSYTAYQSADQAALRGTEAARHVLSLPI
jgi:hypothetical protein